MTNRYVCACGKTAICGAYATRDIRDQQPVLVFCADCTPYLKDPSIWQRNLELLKDRIAAALTEPRGCPTPGACSCVALLAEARRALEDAIFAAEWAMAKMDRGDGVLEYTGTIAEGDEAKRRLDRSRAALGRPAPDGETHSAT